ncbi:T6SS phospholipase effector Tle1-like catalytic domain-containing protein [Parasphingopyxis lamellibrachiae]|uniref:Uncharacterized protein (DUF2235 family) n=1 Tax=Parasphingopyxis lamellibrachiae TaxID=680125 RepID=A0A3D9F767_9SPHN|nr:DUF2235 domain-containing protein [Parasphingopyxis lamellibrachiae]RED12339.1 uncharacterized protein (DUF2235 family) [Parasphingopyxis lamellibrachiae]
MAKNIMIFSDGTGQIGGLKPDQRLSNIYKMYRAMRPGPDSPIRPSEQVAFYDPGLGVGEVGGLTFKRVRKALEAAVGTGIDDNVVDCYEKIISYYQPGDRIFLFGFSRGAYTVRAVANVMNLCGVPTEMPDGSLVPSAGPKLRKIAEDAVRYVYNHGAGYPRGHETYAAQREEKGKRFRAKYKSAPTGGKPDVQGNVQPDFIGVFDTVAALGSGKVTWMTRISFLALLTLLTAAICFSWTLWVTAPLGGLLALAAYWYAKLFKIQWKYFSPHPEKPLSFSDPRDWYAIWKNGHRAVWNKKYYDQWLDSDVGHARHALSINEDRADFPRVKWASREEVEKNKNKDPVWLNQVWFAGCHSDVGGSYPEPESRLSDIALDWMMKELAKCFSDVQVREDILIRSPDPLGLQHSENYLINKGVFKLRWKKGPREVESLFRFHSSVVERLEASAVPQSGEMKPYRPTQLAKHPQAEKFYASAANGHDNT